MRACVRACVPDDGAVEPSNLSAVFLQTPFQNVCLRTKKWQVRLFNGLGKVGKWEMPRHMDSTIDCDLPPSIPVNRKSFLGRNIEMCVAGGILPVFHPQSSRCLRCRFSFHRLRGC